MVLKMQGITPLEISLAENPKNKRDYLMVNDKTKKASPERTPPRTKKSEAEMIVKKKVTKGNEEIEENNEEVVPVEVDETDETEMGKSETDGNTEDETNEDGVDNKKVEESDVSEKKAEDVDPVDEKGVTEEHSDVSEITEVDPQPKATATDGPSTIGNEVAVSAYSAIMNRSKVVPKEVQAAIGLVMERAELPAEDSEKSLDGEARVHVKSLLGVLPEELPEDLKLAVQVIRSWENAGYPMATIEDIASSMMQEVEASPDMGGTEVPVARRVVRSENLIEHAEDMAARLMEDTVIENSVKLAEHALSFAKAVRKALPKGGLIVISGIIPTSDAVSVVHLNDVWKSNDPQAIAVVQDIIEYTSTTKLSDVEVSRKEAEETLTEFSRVVTNAIGNSEMTADAKSEAINTAFAELGARVTTLIQKSVGSSVNNAFEGMMKSVVDKMSELDERIQNMEIQKTKLEFPEKKTSAVKPKARPARKSMISIADGKPAMEERKAISVSDIVNNTVNKRW